MDVSLVTRPTEWSFVEEGGANVIVAYTGKDAFLVSVWAFNGPEGQGLAPEKAPAWQRTGGQQAV